MIGGECGGRSLRKDAGEGRSSSAVSIQLSDGGNGANRAGMKGEGVRGVGGSSSWSLKEIVFFACVAVAAESDSCSCGTGLRLMEDRRGTTGVCDPTLVLVLDENRDRVDDDDNVDVEEKVELCVDARERAVFLYPLSVGPRRLEYDLVGKSVNGGICL